MQRLGMRVQELRAASTVDRPLRECLVNHPYQALEIDWIRTKGKADIVQAPGEGRWLVYLACGHVIAEITEVK